jgi:hypothetical protein
MLPLAVVRIVVGVLAAFVLAECLRQSFDYTAKRMPVATR